MRDCPRARRATKRPRRRCGSSQGHDQRAPPVTKRTRSIACDDPCMSAVTPTTPHAGAVTIPVLDPATGEELGAIPAGDERTVDAAVRAAADAQHDWARTSPADRAGVLKEAARRLRAGDVLDRLAEMQTREGGKPLADSRGGVEAGGRADAHAAGLGPLHRGHALQGAWEATDVMVHEPRGVVALLV